MSRIATRPLGRTGIEVSSLSLGAAGLGEPPSVASPAAVANAVANAIGVRIPSLPITPDKVLGWANSASQQLLALVL